MGGRRCAGNEGARAVTIAMGTFARDGDCNSDNSRVPRLLRASPLHPTGLPAGRTQGEFYPFRLLPDGSMVQNFRNERVRIIGTDGSGGVQLARPLGANFGVKRCRISG